MSVSTMPGMTNHTAGSSRHLLREPHRPIRLLTNGGKEEIHYHDSGRPDLSRSVIIETEFPASSLEKWAQVVVMTYGLAQCRVQPHRDQFEPVLLMRKTNKLSFALCLMSVDEQLQHPWNEQCPANAPTKKKSDNLSAHDGARNSSWPSRKGIRGCGIL